MEKQITHVTLELNAISDFYRPAENQYKSHALPPRLFD